MNDGGERNHYNVTLSVDNMIFFKPIRSDKNLKINTYPTYTSKSTIEIRIDLL